MRSPWATPATLDTANVPTHLSAAPRSALSPHNSCLPHAQVRERSPEGEPSRAANEEAVSTGQTNTWHHAWTLGLGSRPWLPSAPKHRATLSALVAEASAQLEKPFAHATPHVACQSPSFPPPERCRRQRSGRSTPAYHSAAGCEHAVCTQPDCLRRKLETGLDHQEVMETWMQHSPPYLGCCPQGSARDHSDLHFRGCPPSPPSSQCSRGHSSY
mmetsp:Transcript_59251/g.141191  ORF Transcript_59251/g.141191 Transcript_59251/m.141191 type:complete len:215 (-) Transcript_59251:2885-3529(-)